jgi:DNA-directed RNA polymerase subunit omega
MARITSEVAAEMAGGKYELILMASQRARELARGSAPRLQCKNNYIVTALKEIEQGLYTREEYREKSKKRK